MHIISETSKDSNSPSKVFINATMIKALENQLDKDVERIFIVFAQLFNIGISADELDELYAHPIYDKLVGFLQTLRPTLEHINHCTHSTWTKVLPTNDVYWHCKSCGIRRDDVKETF